MGQRVVRSDAVVMASSGSSPRPAHPRVARPGTPSGNPDFDRRLEAFLLIARRLQTS